MNIQKINVTKQSNGWFLSCTFAIPLRSILRQMCNLKTTVYRGVTLGKKLKATASVKSQKQKLMF